MSKSLTSTSILALITALLSPGPVWAQESEPADAAPDAAVSRDADATSDADSGDDGSGDAVRIEDEVVVTGRRAPRAISSIPNSISVIGIEELTAQFGVDENLNSLLTFNVPGFAGRSSSIQQPAVLRGRTALILIDGVPQNQLIRSSGFDVQTIAPEAIDRVEVLRGANAVFGFGATGGVVQRLKRRGRITARDAAFVQQRCRRRFQLLSRMQRAIAQRLDRLDGGFRPRFGPRLHGGSGYRLHRRASATV